MENRPFGREGPPVSVIGQGTWKLRDGRRAEAALRLGLELGLTHIDTAELYQGSEEVVGRAIQDRRGDVFLVSKVLPKNATRKGVVEHCRASLQRLGTDRLDVYLLHWFEPKTPLEESMAGLADVLDAGLARRVGVSNFDVAQLERAQALLGRHKIVCDQVYYSPQRRGLEHDLLPYCAKEGIALVAYSPFGSGRPPPPASHQGETLARIGKRHGASPFQVTLNFLVRHRSVFVIPKAETEAHVRENASCLGFELTKEDLAEMDAAFPRPKPGTPLAQI